jgi:hypothetical protein
MSDRASSPTTLRGRWLLLARVAWVALATIAIGLHVAGIPYAYARTISRLNFDRLASEQVRVLGNLRLTPEFYAAYTVALSVATMLVFAAISTVIFWRRSEDRMALFGAFMLVVFGGAALTSDVPQALAAAHPTLWFPVHLLDYLGQVAFVVFFYVFPNGRFVPRWTRWLAVACALYWVFAIFFPASSLGMAHLGGPIFIGLIGSMVIAQVYRYRRVSGPVERQQTRWVVFGVAVALVGFTMILTLANLVMSLETSGPLGDMVARTVIYGLILLIPLSIGVAILRSGLYDIDVLINRTLVYGSLTALLALMYFGGVTATQAVLQTSTGQERLPQLVIVASTLVIAALFNPLRRGIQSFIDRRFYRRKYDARRTLETFSATLRDETNLEALDDELVGVVRETMQPAHVGFWLRPPIGVGKVGGEGREQ